MSAGTVERPAFVLRPGTLRGSDLRRVLAGEANVVVDPAARAGVERAAEVVRAIAARDESVYGVNTGFGKLAHTRIPRERLADLQRNLVLSHACGVGAPLDAATTRLAIVLKVGSLARGYSGVRWEVIETLLALLERDVVPVIPGQGSVGASGDLAPLAHLSAVLLGVGEAWYRGERMPAADALARAGIAPLALEAKEGLALLNGTQIS
ncbi:MAG: aromatic amino acid lyase, partial [Vulcanimicrobiaceae bacterium]